MKQLDYANIYDKLHKVGYHAADKSNGMEFYNKLANDYDFSSLLDVGCSSGRILAVAKQNGKEACGIDVSQIAIERARIRKRKVCFGSITDIPYPARCFDMVFNSDMLEHLHPDDINRSLAEIVRVSKKYIALQIGIKKARERQGKFRDGKSWTEYAGVHDIDGLHLTIWSADIWQGKFEELPCKILQFYVVRKHVFVLLEKQ